MDQEDPEKLIDRIEKLEALVFDLSNRIGQQNNLNGDSNASQIEATPSMDPVDPIPEITPSSSSHLITFDDEPVSPLSHPLITFDSDAHQGEPESTSPDQDIHNSELWLSRIGITLLLLGLGFLFKYSIDQEWITPMVRVAFGIALGSVLIGFGLRAHESRQMLSSFLLGGGVAAFYITGYAAFQRYQLVPQYLALAFMSGTSLLAFSMAIRQNMAELSLVALAGGLGTPFLLHTGSGNIPGLVLYTCIVLAGAMAIFYFRPWRSLLWSAWVGGWIVMGVAVDQLYSGHPEYLFYSWSVQTALLFLYLLFWWVPLIQKGADWNPALPTKDPAPKTTVMDHLIANRNSHISSLVLFSPLITVVLSKAIWDITDYHWGLILLAATSVYALTALTQGALKRRSELIALHAVVGALMLTIALHYLLEGDLLFLAYAGVATLFNLTGHKLRQSPIIIAAACLFAGVGLWFIVRMFEQPSHLILSTNTAINFSAILLAAFSSTQTRNNNLTRAYGLYAYAGFLALVLNQLYSMPNGNGLISIVWGAMGSLALWAGLRRSQWDIFKTGFGTLILVACKLLIIDLAYLEIIWRILIFLGFGAAFLVISYYMKDQWKTPAADSTLSPTGEPLNP